MLLTPICTCLLTAKLLWPSLSGEKAEAQKGVDCPCSFTVFSECARVKFCVFPMLYRALMPPGWKRSWHTAVRAAKSGKLLAFISAIPAEMRIDERCVENVAYFWSAFILKYCGILGCICRSCVSYPRQPAGHVSVA